LIKVVALAGEASAAKHPIAKTKLIEDFAVLAIANSPSEKNRHGLFIYG
jgi:hypothetical protein